MSKAIMSSTQIGITLSLNIVTQTANDTQLVTLPLVRLTPVIFWLWAVWQILGRGRVIVTQVVDEVLEPIRLTGKIIAIGLTALAFGLGVSR